MPAFPSDIDCYDLENTPCVTCQILTIGQVPHYLRPQRLYNCDCGRYWLRRDEHHQVWEELNAGEFEIWRKDLDRVYSTHATNSNSQGEAT